MGIIVSWENLERTAIRWDFDSVWTWKEFRQAQLQSNFMAMSVAHQVHIIGNMKNSRFIPKNGYCEFARILKGRPANSGAIILIGCSFIVQMMVGTFQKLFPYDLPPVHMVESLIEAYLIVDDYPVETPLEVFAIAV